MINSRNVGGNMETNELQDLLNRKQEIEKTASATIELASNGRMILGVNIEEYENLLNQIEQATLKQTQEKIEQKIEELVVKPAKEELQALLDEELAKMNDTKYYQMVRNKVHMESLNADELIRRGKAVIFEERLESWKKIVAEAETRDQLQYIEYVVEIMESLKSSADIDKAKALYESFMPSFKEANCEVFVKNCVLIYSKFGPEFYRATTLGTLTIKEKIALEEFERQNGELCKLHNPQNINFSNGLNNEPKGGSNTEDQLNWQPIVKLNDELNENPNLSFNNGVKPKNESNSNSNSNQGSPLNSDNSTNSNEGLANNSTTTNTSDNDPQTLNVNINSELENMRSIDDDILDLNEGTDFFKVDEPVKEESKVSKLFKVIKTRPFKWFNKGIKAFEKTKALIVKDALNNKSQEYVDQIIRIENFKNSYIDNSNEDNEKQFISIKNAIADSHMTPKERERAYTKLNRAKAKIKKELDKAIARDSKKLKL